MYKNRLKELREAEGLSQKKMASLLGISDSAYQNYEYGIRETSTSVLTKACEMFGCNLDWILGMSQEDSELIGWGLRPPIKLRLENAQAVAGADMVAVPLRGRVHAGPATEPEDLGELGKTVLIPRALLDADPDTYACESEGDCMDRVYPEGCTIVVSPNRQPQNGSVAVVTIDGHDAVMRRMYRTPNTLVLSPDSHNPEHTDIVITSDSDHTVEFGGKVVWFQAREEME